MHPFSIASVSIPHGVCVEHTLGAVPQQRAEWVSSQRAQVGLEAETSANGPMTAIPKFRWGTGYPGRGTMVEGPAGGRAAVHTNDSQTRARFGQPGSALAANWHHPGELGNIQTTGSHPVRCCCRWPEVSARHWEVSSSPSHPSCSSS